jgi:hypothetical protein
MEGNRVTATFADWKIMMDLLCETAISIESRSVAKDAMVAVQKIITYCKEARQKLGLYPRDLMPFQTKVTVQFYYDAEWPIVRETIYLYHTALHEQERARA